MPPENKTRAKAHGTLQSKPSMQRPAPGRRLGRCRWRRSRWRLHWRLPRQTSPAQPASWPVPGCCSLQAYQWKSHNRFERAVEQAEATRLAFLNQRAPCLPTFGDSIAVGLRRGFCHGLCICCTRGGALASLPARHSHLRGGRTMKRLSGGRQRPTQLCKWPGASGRHSAHTQLLKPFCNTLTLTEPAQWQWPVLRRWQPLVRCRTPVHRRGSWHTPQRPWTRQTPRHLVQRTGMKQWRWRCTG